jgi:hypothetical protein
MLFIIGGNGNNHMLLLVTNLKIVRAYFLLTATAEFIWSLWNSYAT